MKVFFAVILLLAGCATQEVVDTPDVIEHPELREEKIVVDVEKPCDENHTYVCDKHFLGEDNCRCVMRAIDGSIRIP